MPRIHDRDQIRAILARDLIWSVYALGDLSPGLFSQCEWYADPTEPSALLLLYRGFETPVLFALGPARRVAPLLDELPTDPQLYLSVRPDVLALIRERYAVRGETPMWRMVLDDNRFAPELGEGLARLQGRPGAIALQNLYADGRDTGEAPGFYDESMLGDGAYYGIFGKDSQLVAAAGTHLVSRDESVAAIGNVYTRRDRRGCGLGSQVMTAVVCQLRETGIRTIVLNVAQSNAPAVRLYEKLGFTRYCEFYEGGASRR